MKSRPPGECGSAVVPDEAPVAPAAAGQKRADDPQLLLYARDIKRAVDAERRKSNELAAANARLQVLDQLKSDFLAFISHELRTPLSSLATVDLLAISRSPAEQAELLEIVRDGYMRLNAFMGRSLEYFHWLSKPRTPPPEVADMASVLRAAVESLPALKEPDVDFQAAYPRHPCRVRGEEPQLVSVARSILENALKYSPQGKVIRAAVAVRGERVTLQIADRGMGFPPALAREIFCPFTVTEVKHHSAGSGLSLALARVIVESYSGRVHASSEGPGKGATFTIELPLEAPAANARPEGPSP